MNSFFSPDPGTPSFGSARKNGIPRLQMPASFTAEASLLLPPVLLTLLLVLFLCAHIHNRNILTSYACVQAVTGNEQEVSVLFLEEAVKSTCSEDLGERSVSWELHTLPSLSGMEWTESEKIIYKKQKPVRFLQIAYSARSLMPES
ncbi:MAG: hypothetical protein IJJ50_01205 [Lachnospiraceae bacterium]|nr:hypothetical protein [Lachnospiraceae bacterium]